MQAACCCVGCPACSGLPSTISATWSGTYELCFDTCIVGDCLGGSKTLSVSTSLVLNKACNGNSTRYTGIACNIAAFSACLVEPCDPENICQNFTIHASVCLTCAFESIDGTCWHGTAAPLAYPAAPLGDCPACDCETLSVAANTCSIVDSVSCSSFGFAWEPDCGNAALELVTKCGSSSPTGSYVLQNGAGTFVVT